MANTPDIMSSAPDIMPSTWDNIVIMSSACDMSSAPGIMLVVHDIIKWAYDIKLRTENCILEKENVHIHKDTTIFNRLRLSLVYIHSYIVHVCYKRSYLQYTATHPNK